MAKRAQRASLRAEYERLQSEHERLRSDVDALREQATAMRDELRIQFTRIAEIQAVLDEERMANSRSSEPRAVSSAKH